MARCVICGVIAKHMYEIAPHAQPEAPVGLVCWDCKEDLVQSGSDVGIDGSCGYVEACSEPVSYVALVQDTVKTESGIDVVTNREPLLCERHFQELSDGGT